MTELDILFQDEHFIAINKPAKIMVHPNKMSIDKIFLTDILKEKLGQSVHPVHRLDRPTSGALLFALNKEACNLVSQQFRERETKKIYYAICRGWAPEEGSIDRPLNKDKHKERVPALTHFKRLATCTLPYALGNFPSVRYSLMEARPKTGIRHQIRRHFNHLAHPIVCDTSHGDRFHNHLFNDELGIDRLMLHAAELQFFHPFTKEKIILKAPLLDDMKAFIEKQGWLQSLPEFYHH